ncbi:MULTISPECIES: hypothetical protein [unclassified Cellulophaga]|uniref:hypothetical protein n=1 Tax=unclassified Cellulophaga TaxID=2634405 RepID=UPI0026E39E55|nr:MULTISPECIES: hypothetical protein [unclassified Cellulophaga]MDO6491232.1 hypothetical protein [Cellulophaga sp. 2_MG-2023]MDO6495235.1 hypothetical protein [Cellulophaga sp. 3_MG-2023]
MKEKLKQELMKMSTDILTSNELDNVSDLYETAKNLYEKLAVLKFIEEKLHDVEVDVTKNIIAEKFEKLANAVIYENTSVPESNPHQEDIITPGITTIMDMMPEMEEPKATDDMLNEFAKKPEYSKNDQELFVPETEVKAAATTEKVVTNSVTGDIKIGLNDRLAFVKHLFNNSNEDYQRVLSQLSTIDTEERSVSFIVNMVKPDYNNWVGKEEYEERFMAIIERKFA